MLLPDDVLTTRLDIAKAEVVYLGQCFSGVRRLLDIGCGPAVTSILLYKVLAFEHLYLMDGGPARMREGSWFDYTPHPWCDMELTSRVAKLNDVSFTILDPDPKATVKCDAIMSLLSWGHHYPTRVYLPLARRSLPIGGKLVLDLREGRDGAVDILSGGFRMVAQLDQTDKLKRYLFERVY